MSHLINDNIYQNKQDKSGDNKIIQKQNDFCS